MSSLEVWVLSFLMESVVLTYAVLAADRLIDSSSARAQVTSNAKVVGRSSEIWRSLAVLLARLRLICAISLISVGASATTSSAAQAGPTPKDGILVLSSVQYGLPIGDAVTSGLVSTLKSRGISSDDIYVEHLDLNRNRSPEYERQIVTLLRNKLATVRIRMIVVSAQQALNFLVRNDDALFPGVPVVSVVVQQPEVIWPGEPRHVLNIFSSKDVAGTLQQALAVFPRTQRLVVVVGAVDNIDPSLDAARAAIHELAPHMEVEFTSNLTYEEMLDRISSLSAHTTVLLGAYFNDKTGKAFIPAEVAREVGRKANAPVFGLYDIYIGQGLVGGSVVTIADLGRRAGEVIADYLKGQLDLNSPVMNFEAPHKLLFDWARIEHFGGVAAALPENTVFLNRPLTLWEQNKVAVIVVAVAFVVLTTMVVALLYLVLLNAKRRRQVQLDDAKLAAIVNGASDGIIGKDLRGVVTSWNRAAEQIFGYSTQEAIGKTVASLIVPSDRLQEEVSILERVGRGETVAPFTTQRHRRDGHLVDVAVTVSPIRDEVGRVVGAAKTVRDMTEEIRANKRILELNASLEAQVVERTAQLAANERFLNSVIDKLPGLVGYWDVDLRCRFANRAYQDWFGRTKEDMVGVLSLELLGEELFRKNEPFIRGALRGEVQVMERTITKPDGETIHTLAHFLPDLEGDVIRGYIVVSTDITVVKQAEKTLLEAKLKAEDATQAKSAFLANMSHEIRTPMNAILGLCYLLEKQELPTVSREMVQKIHAAGRSLLGIINDILDFSKIEAGRLDIEHVPFRLADVLDNLSSIMSSSLGRKQLELVISPPPLGADFLRGDSLRLGQVLINLAGNAIKFTEQGEVMVRIERLPDDEKKRLRLRFSVSDTGIGIPKEKQELIFQAFSQADGSTTRSFGGTGLGLTISARLVELMGGQLSVESELGQGSEFSFVLPFEYSDPVDSAMPEMAHLRVLVADDHVTARAVLADTVASLGWHADTAESGEQVIAQASGPSAPSYDLLLIDWRMPGIDGLQAATQIQQIRSHDHVPIIIMVTAYDREVLRDRVGSEVADVIVSKPVTSSSLYNAVLQAKRNRGELRMATTTRTFLRRLDGVRLLVVDDSDINRDVAERILADEGASVELAEDGRAALAALHGSPDAFDVVLMDMQMPVMDGYEATRQLRATPELAHLPVIALTAGAFKNQRDQALEAGVDEFVAKPFEVDQLVNVILQLLRRSPPERKAMDERQHEPSMTPQALEEAEAESNIASPVVLNVERGLRVWGEPSVFGRYLHKFLASHAGTVATIKEASPDVATGLAHKLKGTAAQLGIEAVASCAAEIERRLTNGEDARPFFPKLQSAMDAAAHAIRNYGPDPIETTPSLSPTTEAGDRTALCSELERLMQALDSDDSSRVEPILDTLAVLLPAEHLHSLRSAVASYDFRGAEAAARQVAREFKLEMED